MIKIEITVSETDKLRFHTATDGAHTLELGDNTSAEKHNLSEFPEIVMTGLKVSCMVAWVIRRTGNTDAYNEATRLLEFDIHYQVDTLGSTQEAVK